MSILGRIGGAVCILFLVGVVLSFVLENQQPASLLLFGWATSPLPISIYIGGALLTGMFVGPIITWLISISFRKKNPR